MYYTTGMMSRPGGREENQDYAGFAEKNGVFCWALADGLGGHRGGARASRLAVEAMLREFEDRQGIAPEAIETYLFAAQCAILTAQKKEAAFSSMKTTAVVLAADFEEAIWGYLGDSRLYHFRKGKIRFQTKDHSVPGALAESGDIRIDEIRFHEDRNRLLRSLGNQEHFRPQIEKTIHPVEPGDAFLLCTDGFWEYVTEKEMQTDLKGSSKPDEWLHTMEKRILKRAGARHDNYTAIAVQMINS